MRLRQIVLLWLVQVGLMVAPSFAEQQLLLLHTLNGPTSDSFRDGIIDLNFSPDGKFLASVNHNMVKLWDTTDWKNLVVLQGSDDCFRCAAFAPDSRHLIAGDWSNDEGSNGLVCIWTIDGQKTSTIGEVHEKTWPVRSVAFSPEGKRIVAGKGDGTVRVWDFPSGKNPIVLREHTCSIRSVAVSPDGKLIASASNDKTIKLWNMATGKCVKTLDCHDSRACSVKFDPSGKIVASGNDDSTIRLWDVSTGKNIATLGHAEKNAVKTLQELWAQVFYSIAFSPDGKLLASGKGDETIQLWDVKTGENIFTVKGHTDNIRIVAFSPNGKLLASGSADTTIKIWKVDATEE